VRSHLNHRPFRCEGGCDPEHMSKSW
jgi:hypothetical protein